MEMEWNEMEWTGMECCNLVLPFHNQIWHGPVEEGYYFP